MTHFVIPARICNKFAPVCNKTTCPNLMIKASLGSKTFKKPFVKHIQIDLSHNSYANFVEYFFRTCAYFNHFDKRDFVKLPIKTFKKERAFCLWNQRWILFYESQQSLFKALKLKTNTWRERNNAEYFNYQFSFSLHTYQTLFLNPVNIEIY